MHGAGQNLVLSICLVFKSKRWYMSWKVDPAFAHGVMNLVLPWYDRHCWPLLSRWCDLYWWPLFSPCCHLPCWPPVHVTGTTNWTRPSVCRRTFKGSESLNSQRCTLCLNSARTATQHCLLVNAVMLIVAYMQLCPFLFFRMLILLVGRVA